MMRICLLGDAISIHIQRLAAGLAGRGHTVRVVSCKAGTVPGATVKRFHVPPPGWRYPARWHRRRAMYLRRIFRAHDVVHVNFLHDWAITPETAAAGRLVVTPWGSDIVKPPDLAAYPEALVRMRRELLRMADTVLVYGRAFAAPVADFAGLPISEIHSVPLGVDTSAFAPHPRQPDGPPTVGFFKGFKAVYAPNVWVQAIPRVLDAVPDARFDMIGRGPLREQCQHMAHRLGCAAAIRWRDCVPNRRMPEVIGRWSVTVVPSLYESFCVAALESSAMEVPVVASRVGGLVETVKDRQTGLLVPPNDPRTLADAVSRILEDRARAARLGQNGRRFVRTRYEWSRCLDQLLDVYHLTCDRQAGSLRATIGTPTPGRTRTSVTRPVTRPTPASRFVSGLGAAQGDRSRRVLLISAAFPPTGGPGVQRSAKFAKYLPRFGWTPVVWAMPPLPGLPSDPSLVTDVSGVVVVREDADRESKGSGSRRPHNGPRAVRALLKGLLGARADHRPFPDDCAEWARQSVEPALELIAERRIDALYSTFSPASNHRLALELERRTGLPWIADFRDLWTDDYRYREDSPGVRAAHRAVQQTILETADVVVGVSEAQTAILADHVPTHRHKFITVTNGFDPDDFAGLAEHTNAGDEIRRTDGDFILSHVGRFDRWRALDAWFDGLAEFVRYLGPRQHRFVLRIVGHADAATRRRLQDTGARCEFTGYVPHGQAIREMCHATALLLSVPDGPNAETVIPAKLFEYLAAGRPLLVVGPVDGACKSIVRSCGAGVSVGFDAGWIAAALAGLFDQSMRGGAPACSHHDRLGRFDRVTLTRRLASVLDDLVPRRQPRVQEPSLDPLELVVP